MDRASTLVAIATAPGRGGIGIVRLSGKQALNIALQLTAKTQLVPRHAHFCQFIDAANDRCIDEGLAIYFPAPHSFTGEDVVELHGHGGPVLLDLLVKACLKLGAQQAGPGEFSLRAFLNDKLDLTQAEAIADMIDAGTDGAARAAQQSLQGAFSQEVNRLIEALIQLRMQVEAAIDFPEEEIDFLSDGNINALLEQLIKQTTQVQLAAKRGRLLRDGITLVLAGKPNAGKSSLLNALAGFDAAIVTDQAGTTRDTLHEHIQLDGIPVNLIDTAGLRASADVIEQEGIRRAHLAMQTADAILMLVDASTPDLQIERLDEKTIVQTELPPQLPLVWLLNKADVSGLAAGRQADQGGRSVFSVSAKTGAGLAELRQHLKQMAGWQETEGTVFSARRRHLDALDQAQAHFKQGQIHLQQHKAGELLAEDLRLAQQALEEITGIFTADDLLGKIFSSFCIGK